jgi:hypothetical protein
METDLLIALAGLVAAIAIDFFNLTLILKLWKWSRSAVDDIITEATNEILKRINLQVGKSGSTMEKLAEKFSESLQNANQDVPDALKPLNLPLLFAKIQSGNMDIKDFIPLAAKILGNGNTSGNNGNRPGEWK